MAAEAIHQVLADATPTAGAAGTLVVLQLAVTASKAPWTHTLVPIYQVLGVWTGGWVSKPRTTPAPIPSSHPPHSQTWRAMWQPPYLAGAPVLTLSMAIVDV